MIKRESWYRQKGSLMGHVSEERAPVFPGGDVRYGLARRRSDARCCVYHVSDA